MRNTPCAGCGRTDDVEPSAADAVVDAAIAYVEAPEGTDAVEQAWFELRTAVEQYRAQPTA